MERTRAIPLLLLLSLLPAVPAAADDRAAEKADAVVFLPGAGKDGGAPSKEGAAEVVVLSEVAETDPWYAAVKAPQPPAVTAGGTCRAGRRAPAFRRLGELRPGFVVVLVRPDTLDVNLHWEILERASRLDDDPFVDFAFGYVTGATPEEAAAFAAGIAAARRGGIPRTILEFGPTDRPHPVTAGGAHPWAAGFRERRLGHASNDPRVAATLAGLEGVGILQAWGHGIPDRVDEGLTGAEIRAAGLDLSSTLYVSGPCWAGVTGRWFDTSKGGVRAEKVAPEASFLLALLKARSAGVLAGMDPDRGESAHHELEHLLSTGEPLGLVAKSTWDDAVLAYRRERLVLPRYQEGRGRPFRDIHDQMISGGACRALFGDPSWAPFEAAGPEFYAVGTERTKEGLLVTWRHEGSLGSRWSPVDVFRASGGWTHRIRFRFNLPLEEARRLRRFSVVAVTKDGKPLPFLYPTAAVETWGGAARVHGMVVFPRPEGQGPSVFSGGKVLEARFLLKE